MIKLYTSSMYMRTTYALAFSVEKGSGSQTTDSAHHVTSAREVEVDIAPSRCTCAAAAGRLGPVIFAFPFAFLLS